MKKVAIVLIIMVTYFNRITISVIGTPINMGLQCVQVPIELELSVGF